MSIVTLSTDIGWNDYLVGAIKGQLISCMPHLNIIDNTHSLNYANYSHSAYLCKNTFKYYPDNTVHFILLNMFDAEPTHILMAQYNNQYIICPDNGILTMITGEKPEEVVAIIIDNNDATDNITTLDITAVYVDACKKLNDGAVLADLGSYPSVITEKYPSRATFGADWIEGQIIYIDEFENIVINIRKEDFDAQRQNRKVNVQFTRTEHISEISSNYSSVPAGNLLAWFNSAGYLEIAINKGNVAGLFGLQGNSYYYKTVRIFFEKDETTNSVNISSMTTVLDDTINQERSL